MIVNTDPRHSEMERIALSTVAEPLDSDPRAWESVHTGGGCMAWMAECDDGAARILICDVGNGLGDAETDCWLIGLHPYAEWLDHWQGEAKTLQEALNLATMAQAARAFALGFRADAPMTFREFVASGRDVASLDDEGLGEEGAGRVYAYHGGPFINGTAETGYSLTVGNWTGTGELPGLERRLYEFASSEGMLKPRREAPANAEAPAPVAPVVLPWGGNLDTLAAELEAYATKHGLELASADEMELVCGMKAQEYATHARWLHDYCDRWREEEARLDASTPAAWSDDFARQPDAVARLAAAFRDVLQEWIGTVGMAKVRRENVALAGTGSCASHNYCDANMAMEEATRRTFGAGPLDGLDHMTDAATALWNAAWEKAHADYLTDAA